MEQGTEVARVPVDIGTQGNAEKSSEPGMISRAMTNVYQRMDADTKRFGLAVITTVALPIIIQLAFHNVLLTILVLAIPFLGWGIRVVPKFHNGLMSLLWVRRTKVGFSEGPVWVPWFLGATLEMIDVRRNKYDIKEEDNWTQDQMHLVYDIMLQYGVQPIEKVGLFRNFFQVFTCLFNWQSNALSLYLFTENVDRQSAVDILDSVASDLTIKAVNSRGFGEIFGITPEGQVEVRDQQTIQEEVIIDLNSQISDIGLVVYKFLLKDVDFHEDTSKILQTKFLATVHGEARERLYEVISTVAKKLVEAGPGVSETAIRIETVEAMKKAADGEGVIGMLLQSLIAGKTLPTIPPTS